MEEKKKSNRRSIEGVRIMNIIQEAKGCNTCFEWHKHCDAECCKVFFLRLTLMELQDALNGKTLRLKRDLDSDRIWHYKIHGCDFVKGRLIVPSKIYRIKLYGERTGFHKDCIHLKDNKCMIHKKKPKVCEQLNLENVRSGKLDRVVVTKNCLFGIKVQGESKK